MLLLSTKTEFDELPKWLVAHMAEIENATLEYDGERLTKNTELCSYQMIVSLLLATLRITSPVIRPGTIRARRYGFFYTVGSLLFGWWAIPFGPFCTLLAVARNAMGGRLGTVGEIVYAAKWGRKTDPTPADDRRDLIELTEGAACELRRRIRESGHAADVGVLVRIDDAFSDECRVEFDFPFADGNEWIGQSRGITLLLDKAESAARGMDHRVTTLDFLDGRFVLK